MLEQFKNWLKKKLKVTANSTSVYMSVLRDIKI